MATLTVAQLAELCRGEVTGDPDRSITGANALETASENELSFAVNSKALESVSRSRAGCLLVPPHFSANGSWSIIRVSDPRSAFARILAHLYPEPKPSPSRHQTAVIASSARIASTAFIGAFVTIGENSTIGEHCVIEDHCLIGDGVRIGAGSRLKPQVTLYPGVRVGYPVLLHSGSVIGADGFGFALVHDHYEKFPQVGTVEIG